MNAPTPTQARTLAVIASLTLLHGRAPTQRELAEALSITRQAAGERLAWMRKKGLLAVRHERWSGTSRITRAGVSTVAAARCSAAPPNSV